MVMNTSVLAVVGLVGVTARGSTDSEVEMELGMPSNWLSSTGKCAG